MSHEFATQPPDDFDAKIKAFTTNIKEWMKKRGSNNSHEDTTERKLVQRLAAITREFGNTHAYIQAPLLLLPMADGSLSVGTGEVTGKIIGFQYSRYPRFDESLAPAVDEGVIAIIATGGTNVEDVSHASWDKIIPEEGRAFIEEDTVPALVPIVDTIQFTRFSAPVPGAYSVSQIVSAEQENKPPIDHRAFVKKIETLMGGRYIMSHGVDDPILSALNSMLLDMNINTGLVGKEVEIDAKYIRLPNFITPGKTPVIEGVVSGVLRKFTYETYFAKQVHAGRENKGAVHAILYPREIAELVYAGMMTAEEAETRSGIIRIPLDQDHKLRVKEE